MIHFKKLNQNKKKIDYNYQGNIMTKTSTDMNYTARKKDRAIKLICKSPVAKGQHTDKTSTDIMDTPIDINKLKYFYANHNKVDANFHAWNVDKQGNIIDDYKDPNTECGRALGLIMKLHGYTTLAYEPFSKKKCKQYKKLLNKYTTFADEYEPFKIYMKYGDHTDSVGRCLQRAWKGNYFNNYKVVIGMVYMVKENGDRIAVEGDEVNDGWFCKKHLQLCMNAFMESQFKLEEWRTAINFFANNKDLMTTLEPIAIQKKKEYLRSKLRLLAMRMR